MSEVNFRFRVQNDSTDDLDIWVEPWGDYKVLPAGQDAIVQVAGPDLGDAEILQLNRSQHAISIWAWSGSNLTLKIGKHEYNFGVSL